MDTAARQDDSFFASRTIGHVEGVPRGNSREGSREGSRENVLLAPEEPARVSSSPLRETSRNSERSMRSAASMRLERPGTVAAYLLDDDEEVQRVENEELLDMSPVMQKTIEEINTHLSVPAAAETDSVAASEEVPEEKHE